MDGWRWERTARWVASGGVPSATGPEARERTGLGLSISPQYVRLMGGGLTMLSALREGSKFCFGLRVAPTDAAIPYVAETVRPRVVGLAPRPPSYRLLALDDKPENRRLLV